MKNFNTTIDRTGPTLAAGKINYLRTLLRGEALLEFEELASHNTGTNNSHLKFIQESLLGCFPPVNNISKQKRLMRRAMCKPRKILFKNFPPVSRNRKNISLFFSDQAPPRRFPPKNSTRFSFTASRTDGQNRPIYMVDISK